VIALPDEERPGSPHELILEADLPVVATWLDGEEVSIYGAPAD